MSLLPPPIQQRLKLVLQPQRVAILEACLIGLVSGLAAVILQQGISRVGTLRLQLVQFGPPWLILGLFGLLGGLIAVAVTVS